MKLQNLKLQKKPIWSRKQKSFLIVAAEGTGLVQSNELSEDKVKSLSNMDYDEFKHTLGLKSDFCVYFEDANGNLIRVDSVEPGIGSGKIKIRLSFAYKFLI